jgi:hypothetical protein
MGGFNPPGDILSNARGGADQIVTGSIQENLFIQGKAFSYEDYITFAADEIKVIVFDSALFEGVNLTFNPIILGASSGPILADFYTGTTSDADGTILQASNRREGMPGPKSILRMDPSNIVLGTRFSGDTVFASGLGVGNANAGSNLPGLPFGLDPSINHAIEIENDDGAGTIIQIKMTWFES